MTVPKKKIELQGEGRETADRIVAAATQLFAERGFEGTSTKEICDSAKVNIAAIHYHFGTKDNLYRHIIEQFASERLDFSRRTLQEPKNVEDFKLRLELFLAETLEYLIRSPELFRIVQREMEMCHLRSEAVFRATMHRHFETLVEFLKKAKRKHFLSSDIDPFMAARALVSQVVHQMRIDHVTKKYFGLTFRDEKYRSHWVQSTLRMFLGGVLNKLGVVGLVGVLSLFFILPSFADVVHVSLKEAEKEALDSSKQLEAFQSESEAAIERSKSVSAPLYPRLSLDGSYRYVTEVPNAPGSNPPVPYGSHSNYSIGPTLSYTLWDTGGSSKALKGAKKFAAAKKEDVANARLLLLANVRNAYVRAQLSLEETKLVYEFVDLARARYRDISNRFKAGASSRLDLVTAQRQVISYELQYRQKQSELSFYLKDLWSLLGRDVSTVSNPGPEGLNGISYVVTLEPLEKLLEDERGRTPPPPDGSQPMLQSQKLTAEASKLNADSQKASLFPTLQVSARTSLDYPDGPIRKRINQNTFGATFSMPLFEGGKIRHEAAAKLKEAEAIQSREEQLKRDLNRDYEKAKELLENLKEQKKLANEDVSHSEDVAKLYLSSYRAGRTNLIDVQNAEVQALQSKVNSVRISAQLMQQYVALKFISGKEIKND